MFVHVCVYMFVAFVQKRCFSPRDFSHFLPAILSLSSLFSLKLVICMSLVITYCRVPGMNQPGKVANAARGQLSRKMDTSPSPFVPENLVSRSGLGRPVPRQPTYSPRSG